MSAQLVGPLKPDNEGNLHYRYKFKIDPQWKSQDLQITAFVQEPTAMCCRRYRWRAASIRQAIKLQPLYSVRFRPKADIFAGHL